MATMRSQWKQEIWTLTSHAANRWQSVQYAFGNRLPYFSCPNSSNHICGQGKGIYVQRLHIQGLGLFGKNSYTNVLDRRVVLEALSVFRLLLSQKVVWLKSAIGPLFIYTVGSLQGQEALPICEEGSIPQDNSSSSWTFLERKNTLTDWAKTYGSLSSHRIRNLFSQFFQWVFKIRKLWVFKWHQEKAALARYVYPL